MDKKNFIAFLALSLAVLLLGNLLFPPPPQQPKPKEVAKAGAPADAGVKAAPNAKLVNAPRGAGRSPTARSRPAGRRRPAGCGRSGRADSNSSARFARSGNRLSGCSSRSPIRALPFTAPSSPARVSAIWYDRSGYLGRFGIREYGGRHQSAGARCRHACRTGEAAA